MNLDKIDLLIRLQSVSKFSVTARDTNNWSAVGDGAVMIEQSSIDTVVWREKGTWNQNLGYLEFSNVYRWTKSDDKKFRLEHLRFGDDKPVVLVDIKPLDGHHWQSIAPHYCGQDEYFLSIKLKADQLILDWRIMGPNKDQQSTIYYS